MLPSFPKLSQSALVIGQTDYLLRPVSYLLDRSGFDVSVLYRGDSLHIYSSIQALCISKSDEMLMTDIQSMLDQKFDLIVLADDLITDKILKSHLPDAMKSALFPVNSKQYWVHLCSKNALSEYLQDSNVIQPPFIISKNPSDLEQDALALGFPLLLKIDFSGGGTGVFECDNLEEVRAVKLPPNSFPLLLQQKIPGPVIDLSGFFYQGNIIHFSYAQFLYVDRPSFGPSEVRQYLTRHSIDPSIVDELNELGRALGLNGFVNISCIHSTEDGKRYYFEADVRPNVWVNFPYYLNDDPAKVFNAFFQSGKTMSLANFPSDGTVTQLQMPYMFRLSFLAIVLNKYDVWRYSKEYPLEEIGRCLMGLIKIQILQWNRGVSRSYQMLKQQLYHRPIYLTEMALIKHVKPKLPKRLATQLIACF
jgi:hypothetical protein